MIEPIGRLVGTDVGPHEEHLAVPDFGEALLEADPPFLDRFDFTPHENDAGLEGLEQEVLVARLAIGGNDLNILDHKSHSNMRGTRGLSRAQVVLPTPLGPQKR